MELLPLINYKFIGRYKTKYLDIIFNFCRCVLPNYIFFVFISQTKLIHSQKVLSHTFVLFSSSYSNSVSILITRSLPMVVFFASTSTFYMFCCNTQVLLFHEKWYFINTRPNIRYFFSVSQIKNE